MLWGQSVIHVHHQDALLKGDLTAEIMSRSGATRDEATAMDPDQGTAWPGSMWNIVGVQQRLGSGEGELLVSHPGIYLADPGAALTHPIQYHPIGDGNREIQTPTP